MQTVASLAGRLDMTAEEAVEKLRYMLFDVEGIDSVITDEQCDLLIDADEDGEVVERVRKKRLEEGQKAEKRAQQRKEAAKKAVAKRKAAAVKKAKAAKAKAAPKKRRVAKKKVAEEESVLPAEEVQEEAAEAASVDLLPRPTGAPVAVILPAELEQEVAAAVKPPPESGLRIGVAAEHEGPPVQVLRADGTRVEAAEVELIPEPEAPEREEEEHGLLAEAERRQEEEEKRRAKQLARPTVKPDPAVVAEVKRRAAERRLQKLRSRGIGEAGKGAATGKTARKRQKELERARVEETKRREAAVMVRELLQTLGPTGTRRKRRRVRDDDGVPVMEEVSRLPVLELEELVTVEQLAERMETPVNDLILDLMDLNVLASKNQILDMDLIRKVAEVRGFELRWVIPEEEEVLAEEPESPADLQPRAPVITVMGHVDHGKTTLLDRVRHANVAAGEVGGITQHIAAYEVQVGSGRVVFLDTPGHEAFTQMRARGAQVTDVVVLVVAADDGVMPQTVEAIDHARAADVPIVVAINKCDKPDAQPVRIRQDLTHYGLVSEEWGGKTIIKNISAKTGEGVEELMELLVLEAELLELKANPNKRARGAIIESEISRGHGPVAWVLVQSGTLRLGDEYIAGPTWGRVRAMFNSRGESVEKAGPSTPVLVTGFSQPPEAGDQFVAVEEERVARLVASKRADLTRQRHAGVRRHITLEDFHERLVAGEKQELRVIIKADVQGSEDVLESSLAKLGNEEVQVTPVHAGVGAINESDVLLASASDAVIVGFHVTANPRAQKLAEQEGVDIRTYEVIYEAIDDVRKALEGLLTPETREIPVGRAEIRQVFHSSAAGNIAGCHVVEGEMTRGASLRVLRDGVMIHDGKLATLRRGKEDIRSVQSGFECGIKIEGFEDIQEGDVLEAYRIETVAKTLA